MIQIMTHESAAERDLFTRELFTPDPVTGKQVPFTTWRVELTEQQKQEQKKQVDEGVLPF